MNLQLFFRWFFCWLIFIALQASAAQRRELQVGIAGHAFEHLGDIGDQAEAAAASGATIIYSSGVAVAGYQGLPTPDALNRQVEASKTYLRNAKKHGIHLALGYICATSIVKLEAFDKNWP